MNTLTYQELSQILAALRHWQNEENSEFMSAYPHFDDVEPLTHDEIDELCEKLNCLEPNPS